MDWGSRTRDKERSITITSAQHDYKLSGVGNAASSRRTLNIRINIIDTARDTYDFTIEVEACLCAVFDGALHGLCASG